jgi:hypothetical protein
MKIRFALLVILIAAVARPNTALADGGTLQLSQRVGQYQLSVFTSPAAPRVGPVDVSMLVQDAARGNIESDIPVVIAVESIEAPAIPLIQRASSTEATNKLFQSAIFDVPQAGMWRVKVGIGEHSTNAVEFNLAVGPPLPPWLSLAPWVAWPFAIVVAFLIHQRLKCLSARRRPPARKSSTSATMRSSPHCSYGTWNVPAISDAGDA